MLLGRPFFHHVTLIILYMLCSLCSLQDHYLLRSLQALRVHPGVQLSMGRIVPEKGMALCGTFIPAGYWIGVNPAVVHFDREVFGDDADQFRPERWLESSAATMDKYMLHFGAGTRTCIGKNISLAEIHKLIPDVLRNFELEMFDKGSNWTTRNLWFCKQENILVRLKKREAQA